MPHYEYKVIPAPTKAEKAKGVKTSEGRFAHTIEGALNRMGAEGWEYLRAELLPHEERSGLKAAQTKWRTVLVFRRSQDTEAEALHARVVDASLPVGSGPVDPVPVLPPVLPPVVAEAVEVEDPPLTAAEDVEDVADETVVPLSAHRDEDGEEEPR